MTVNFTKGQFNLREKLKELERPSVDKLVTKDADGKAYIDTISGNTKLENIDSVISDTAVDVFVYDTRKDSDGGDWRKRTQHTSWYNETLNTATRGSRREFPAVAVVVAESNQVTIYDGDDPDLPMWMVFNTTAGSMLRSAAITATSMLNGELCVCHTSGSGFHRIWFLKDTARWLTASTGYGGYYGFASNSGGTTIAERNTAGGNYLNNINGASDIVIVSSNCNDVAMTVLPNAPIDSATGLPTPTIAVATDGGVSIIKDDGTVVDLTYLSTNTISRFVDITSDGKIRYGSRSYSSTYNFFVFVYKNIPSADTSAAPDTTYTYTSSGSGPSGGGNGYYYLTTIRNGQTSPLADCVDIGDGEFVISTGSYSNGGQYGIHKIVEYDSFNSSSVPEPLVAIATTSFNTGWLHGNCKGAFLSDTDATNVTGTELVTSNDFSASTGWTLGTGWAIAGGVATHTEASGAGDIYQDVNLTIGETYTVTFIASSEPVHSATTLNTTFQILDINDNLVWGVSNFPPTGSYIAFNGSLSYSHTFTATSTTSYITVRSYSDDTVSIDSVSVRIADPDRSVNNKGLQVFGTITKSAVATGADLVAYSGWSNSNYLVQPYNSDLNFGTGDFSTSFWIYTTDANLTGFVFDRGGPVNNTDPRFAVYIEGDAINLYTYASAAASTLSHSFDEYENQWTHVVMTRSSSGAMQIFINGTRVSSGTATVRNVTSSTNPELTIGNRFSRDGTNPLDATISLLRISGSIPSAEQVKKMYEDEKVLFQENAACTLYGSSDAVTALAYDDSTNLLYAGTSSGRSDFQGLRRINNTTTAVTTAMSASNGLVAEQ